MFAACLYTTNMEEQMFIPANEAAEQCGISIEKLEKLANRKDCPKKMIDGEGNYNPGVVNKFLARMERIAADTAVRQKQQRDTWREQTATKRGCKARRSIPEQETLEEFQQRFWETDNMWQDFCLNDMSEEWVRYFIRKALEFGHNTAYPE